MVQLSSIIFIIISYCSMSLAMAWRTNCSELFPGQYLCLDLNIDPKTQQSRNCDKNSLMANVTCTAAPHINCTETGNSTFIRQIPCK